jgi:hypothetical protein
MRHTLTDDSGTLNLVAWSYEARARALRVDDLAAASIVRRFMASLSGRADLRGFLETSRSSLVRELSDEQVSAVITRMLARGEILVLRRRPVNLWARDGEEEAESAPQSGSVAEQPTAWLEIELVEADGRRVGGELYEVRAADGRIFRGRLDGEGFARVDGLAPGGSVVTFPQRDRRDWEGRTVVVPEGELGALPPPRKSWVEIELVDEAGAPVAGEPYLVLEGDRPVARGKLDAEGRARVESISPGTCRVLFPARDGRDLALATP